MLVQNDTFVKKLWAVIDPNTNAPTAISDDKNILSKNNNAKSITEILPIKNNNLIDEFTVIENSNTKEYGLSEGFWKDENGYDMTYFQCPIVADPNEKWKDTLERFREDFGSKSSWADSFKTINDAVNGHIDWWMNRNNRLTDNETPAFFELSPKDVKTLLLTGFKADRIFIVDTQFPEDASESEI